MFARSMKKKSNPLYTHELPKLSEMFSKKEIILSGGIVLAGLIALSFFNVNIVYVAPVALVLAWFVWR